jgi:hypothetical protein
MLGQDSPGYHRLGKVRSDLSRLCQHSKGYVCLGHDLPGDIRLYQAVR